MSKNDDTTQSRAEDSFYAISDKDAIHHLQAFRMVFGMCSRVSWALVLLCVAVVLHTLRAQQRELQKKRGAERPGLSLNDGRDGRSSGMSSADRRQQEEYSTRVKQKKKKNPELFVKKSPLGAAKTDYPPVKGECGQTVLHDRVVTTAVIITDPLMAKFNMLSEMEADGTTNPLHTEEGRTKLEVGELIDKSMSEKVTTQEQLIEKRTKHAREFMSSLPLAYEEWPSVIAGRCPNSQHVHKASERGLAMAHHQVWQEWYRRQNTYYSSLTNTNSDGGTNEGTALSKEDKHCALSPEQDPRMLKDGKQDRTQSRDLLVVFEDDAAANIPLESLGPALMRELDNIATTKVDLTFLGWCYGGGRSMPMCAHAYVVTRNMVRVLLEHYDSCGPSVDAQWHELGRKRVLKWAKAHHESFNGTDTNVSLIDAVNGNGDGNANLRQRVGDIGAKETNSEYFRGMFKQANLGSFNDHEWMPNAKTSAEE